MLPMIKLTALEKTNYSYTGSKILRSIMDNHTPNLDLFVRESIQNSLDEVLEDKEFVNIAFYKGNFSYSSFLKKIDFGGYNTWDISNDVCSFITISDSNTGGLLGTHKEEKNKSNNLYNLVYDFMNNSKSSSQGGSFGIGKSVFYRFGRGVCFYYSRTFEDGKYISKLTGLLIQDEKLSSCILGESSSGIAFFGEEKNGESIPIYDENIIRDFLSVFNIKEYDGDKTGTVVLIPFLNEDILLKGSVNSEEKHWRGDLLYALNLAVQRWYFPRINNLFYKGKYAKIYINSNPVELIPFFNELQKLYNMNCDDAVYEEIRDDRIKGQENLLGYFCYKKFSNEDLQINIPPNNLGSIYSILDIEKNSDDKNSSVLFYTRKSGMILTYANDKFGEFSFDDDSYLIGVFVLNDDLEYQNESLGKYMRKTENANHEVWSDDSQGSEFPCWASMKPFGKICRKIKKLLQEKFNVSNVVICESHRNAFQILLAKKLMPPEGYGQEPTTPKRLKDDSKRIKISKKKHYEHYVSITNDGLSCYSFNFELMKNQLFECQMNIDAGTKLMTSNEWIKYGFAFPCRIESLSIEKLEIDDHVVPGNVLLSDVESICKSRSFRNTRTKNKLWEYNGLKSINNEAYGFTIKNCNDTLLKMSISIIVKPIDLSYKISFNENIIEKEGDLNE